MELDKILSGKTIIKIGGKSLVINPPTKEIKQRAEIFANEYYEKAFCEGIFLFEELLEDWSEEDEIALTKTLPNNLDEMKLDYYRRFYNPSSRKEIKLHIMRMQRKISELFIRKHSYYPYSCEHLRDNSYLYYCIEHSLEEEANIEQATYLYQEQLLDSEQIRAISKSSHWRTLWMSATEKSSIFGLSPGDLTRQQIELISFSRMYDNVFQSMDCPPDEIVDDDLALDGWFVEQRKKREEESAEKRGSKIAEKTGGNEIFVPVRSKNDIKKITDMNSNYGKGVLKSLKSDLEKTGELEEKNLSHVRQSINMEINKQAFKGRK